MNKIIGEPGKSKYNPKLAARLNKLAEQGKLEKTLKIITIEDICKGYKEYMDSIKTKEEFTDNIPTDITEDFNPTKEQILEFSKKLINYKDLNNFNPFTSYYLSAFNSLMLIVNACSSLECIKAVR